ncbi:MAG: helix-turn-helix domain-containing protein [Acholeplasmataceae bacterium]
MPDVIDNVRVGQLIKKKLKERNMTQEQLADLLNISKSAVSQNVNGKSSFDIQNLMKIANIFNMSIDELISQKSGNEKDVISEYERVVRKGIDELRRVPPKDLNIKDPDLYGKVFIEYVIEYERVDMFTYLDEAGIALYNDYHHQAQRIALRMILFMLEKNIKGVEKHVYAYVKAHGSFRINDEDLEKGIMERLDQPQHQTVLKNLLSARVQKERKVLGLPFFKEHLSVMTHEQWLELFATYGMHNALNTYMKTMDVYTDYPLIVRAFVEKGDGEGIRLCLEAVKREPTESELRRMKAQRMARTIALLDDLELFVQVIEKGLFTDINDLIRTLILEDKKTLYEDCLSRTLLPIDYGKVLLAAIEKDNDALLLAYIDRLSQDEKDYLLAQASPGSYPIIDILIRNNARFVAKYHDHRTYTKVNGYIRYLHEQEKGVKTDA